MLSLEIRNDKTKITGNPVVVKALFDYLKFKHPDAYFIKKRLNFQWDGFVYPLTKHNYVATGLLDYVMDFLEDEEDDYSILDHRRIPDIGTIPDVVGGLRLEGKFAFQKEVIEAVVRNTLLGEPHPRGIIAAAVNAGKSTIMMGIHMTYIGARTLILINNAALYDQFKDDLAQAFPDSYGYMRGKKVKWGRIMVVMVQTLANRLEEYEDKLREFNVLLTDECDLANNKTFDSVYKFLSHISVRAGFTGTVFLRELKKDQLKNIKMREIFGNALYTITNKELEDRNISTRTVVKMIMVNNRVHEDLNFKEEFDTCVTHNESAQQLVLERALFNLRGGRKPMMIFCKFIEQTENLYHYLRAHLPKKYSMEYTHHKRSTKELIDSFRAGKINVLVTSLYLKRGMNFPLTECIINVAGGEGYTGPLQVLGRGTRSSKTKDVFYLEDFFFNGTYLTKHSRKRIGYYKKMGHEVRVENKHT